LEDTATNHVSDRFKRAGSLELYRGANGITSSQTKNSTSIIVE